MNRIIREAKPADIPEIMQVIEAAKKIMRSSGNMRQWGDGYPSEALIFSDIMDFCFSHDSNIRIDTHKDNRIMQHNIKKYGFTYCGIIYLANGRSSESHYACTNGRVVTDEGEANENERLAYQKLNGQTAPG